MNFDDIARKAGVSRSTVSRFIHNEPCVSEKTSVRVKATIAHGGFAPNPAARKLLTQPSQHIGFIIPQNPNSLFDDTAYYFPTLLQGASQEVGIHDSRMLLWPGCSSGIRAGVQPFPGRHIGKSDNHLRVLPGHLSP
jgi:DNA-binding LacI/PurR family transcriptional regulator